jgi:exonuclease VII small subunit
MAVETDLEAAIRLLAEGEERLREQIKFVQTLVRDGKPTDFAMDLCRSTRKTLEEIQTHIDYLRETANRRD